MSEHQIAGRVTFDGRIANNDICAKCEEVWPCDFTQARMQRDALRTALTAAQATIAQRDAQVAALRAELADIRMKHDHLAAIVDAQDQEDAIASMTPGTSTYYGEYAPTLTEQLAARDAQVAELTAALQAVMRRIDRTGKACWCPPIFDDRTFHTSDCLRAKELMARTPAAPQDSHNP